jgi:hypothetical protein
LVCKATTKGPNINNTQQIQAKGEHINGKSNNGKDCEYKSVMKVTTTTTTIKYQSQKNELD